MPTAAEQTLQAITYIFQMTAIGTNLSLVRVVWCMVNGSFLQSRGALIPALTANGLSPQEARRCWSAVRYGKWEINSLLDRWQEYVTKEGQWAGRSHEGYEALSVDMTGFWRPQLKGWTTKHFHNLAKRALPAVVFGVIVISGQVNKQRIPLLRRVVRLKKGVSKPAFRSELLEKAGEQATATQVVVVDAEFKVTELQSAKVKRYVVRMASNCTARRNRFPEYKGRGPYPKYGDLVRPLARRHKGNELPATAPDGHTSFEQDDVTIEVSYWHDLVAPDQVVDAEIATFSIYVFRDPRYKQPLILATNLTDVPPAAVLELYQDRWPVEQAPLATKQMIGLHRQFVFTPRVCCRLPELGFLAANVLTYCAAVLPPMPTGYWDRKPKATPGRLRRRLAEAKLPNLADIDPKLRKKNAVFAHLPTGINGHRRQKSAA